MHWSRIWPSLSSNCLTVLHSLNGQPSLKAGHLPAAPLCSLGSLANGQTLSAKTGHYHALFQQESLKLDTKHKETNVNTSNTKSYFHEVVILPFCQNNSDLLKHWRVKQARCTLINFVWRLNKANHNCDGVWKSDVKWQRCLRFQFFVFSFIFSYDWNDF